MNRIPVTFAKLAALYKELQSRLTHWRSETVTPEFGEYFERYSVLNNQLREDLPNLYSDLPIREVPKAQAVGRFLRTHVDQLVRDMAYIFEVKANSELRVAVAEEPVSDPRPARVFISHGKSPDWREVQDYIERDLTIQL